jgi:23S rRNA (adenine2503-C2)-methyltransferase
MGFRRQLSSWEILEQVLRSGMLGPKSNVSDDDNAVTTDTKRRIDPTIIPVRNIVFMGMGEPLHNLSAVTESLERLTDEAWFGLSPRTITVSTAGVPRGMIALAQRFPRLRLALSLHSAEPSKRRDLVPHAVGDLEKLRSTIAEVNRLQEGPVWIEIALLAGVNDGLDDARKLVEFCEGLRVEVNVIPYNDTSHSAEALPQFGQAASYRAPAIARVDAYIGELRRSGIFTTFRKTLGESIQAACGQLVAPVRDVSQ